MDLPDLREDNIQRVEAQGNRLDEADQIVSDATEPGGAMERARATADKRRARLNDPEEIARAERLLAGSETLAERQLVDRAVQLYQQGQAAGMNSEELEVLRTAFDESANTPDMSAAYAAAVDAVLQASNRRTSGLQALMERKLAEARGETYEDEDESEAAPVPSPDLADPSDVEAILARLGEEETREGQAALLAQVLAQASQVPDPGLEERERALVARENPLGSQVLEALAGAATYAEQAAMLEEFIAANQPPPPEVDRNNPARPLMGGRVAAQGGLMTAEIADAILADAGPVALAARSRRR